MIFIVGWVHLFWWADFGLLLLVLLLLLLCRTSVSDYLNDNARAVSCYLCLIALYFINAVGVNHMWWWVALGGHLCLDVGSCLNQFNPCRYSHLSLSIHSVSCCLRVFSICSSVSLTLGMTLCSGWIVTFSMPLHLSLLKCSCRAPVRCLSLIVCMCLANLDLRDFCVWPTLVCHIFCIVWDTLHMEYRMSHGHVCYMFF